MSQIQGTSSASYASQWQYLQAIQSSQTGPMLQPGGSDPMSFGLDALSGSGSPSTSSTGSGPSLPFSLGAMSALIDAQEQASSSNGLSRQQQKVFGELDADGDGTITGTELQNAFGSDNKDIASYVMSKLDTNGDGSISKDEFAAGTTRGMGHHHHHMHAQSSDGSQGAQNGAQDPLAQLMSATGASSTSTSNSDGSTTTTISYADGSKVSMTSAAATSSDNSTSTSTTSASQQNLLEQLIKMQAQLIQSMSSAASTAASSALATV
jgi:hypothetical protein